MHFPYAERRLLPRTDSTFREVHVANTPSSIPFYPSSNLSPASRATLVDALARLALLSRTCSDDPTGQPHSEPTSVPKNPGCSEQISVSTLDDLQTMVLSTSTLELMRLIEGHGIAALILGALPKESMSEELGAAIQDLLNRMRERHQALEADRERVEALLDERQIGYALIKSSVYAKDLYREAFYRPRADMDYLVNPDQVAEARSGLASLAYIHEQSSWKHSRLLRDQDMQIVDGRGEHANNPRPLEIHAALSEMYRGIEIQLPIGRSLGSIDPLMQEDWIILAHIASHTSVDLLSRKLRIIQLADLRRMVDHFGEETFEALAAWAENAHRARFIWPALHLACRYAGLVDPPWLQAIGRCCRPALCRFVQNADIDELSYFGRSDRQRDFLETWRIWPISKREMLRICRFALLPPRLVLADRYPDHSEHSLAHIYVRHLRFNLKVLRQRILQSRSSDP